MAFNNNKAIKKREGRLAIVSEFYKKGYSYERIRQEVMNKLDLNTYSKSTVHKDVQILLNEWREYRVENMDLAVQLELERINSQETELWEAWEKSKSDHKLTSKKQKGIAGKQTAVGEQGLTSTDKIVTTGIERIEKDEINFGDPRYQEVINRLGQERRKLLGLYAPEKKELSGEVGFYGFLQSVNVIEDEK